MIGLIVEYKLNNLHCKRKILDKKLKPMESPVNQDSPESQKEYFLHLNITSWKGRLYRNIFFMC